MEPTLKEIAQKHGIPYPCLWHRVKVKGLSVPEAVAWGVPPKRRNRYNRAVCLAAQATGLTREGIVARMERFNCTAAEAAAMGPSMRSKTRGRSEGVTVLDLTELPDLHPDLWHMEVGQVRACSIVYWHGAPMSIAAFWRAVTGRRKPASRKPSHPAVAYAQRLTKAEKAS